MTCYKNDDNNTWDTLSHIDDEEYLLSFEQHSDDLIDDIDNFYN